MIIAIDTGGTFTDFIYKNRSGWGVHKQLSTPENPANSVLDGIALIAETDDIRVIHGSTVATNAILEKKGAITALITNRGFEDVIEIGRQNRTELYNLFYQKNPPLVPSQLRFGIGCRVNSAGEIIESPDENELAEILRCIQSSGAESVGVSFLFSFKNPAHEIQVGKMLSEANIPVSLSHEILSEFREYERTSTTVINAYISPKMENYIDHIAQTVGEERLSIMQSNGGSISAATAKTESVRTILSGPAGGAVGAFEIGKMAGYDRLITFDMGGTSTDVALIDGSLPMTLESEIANYPVKVPMIDIHTVGAGGGSVAFTDAGGSLRVGPESAGANPGPICYGKGERITVTDANLFLGRLIPENFLGGNMHLHVERLDGYFNALSHQLGLTPVELAEGILTVANATMERAIRVISVERGFNPSDFTLFSFGGAGGMHATFLAKQMKIPKVFVPENPGILSAIGMLMADIIKDYSQTVMTGIAENVELETLFTPLEDRAYSDLKQEGISDNRICLEKYLDMRYQGQSYEIITPLTADYIEAFHQLHEKMYGYCNQDKMVEIVNIRLRARGIAEKTALSRKTKSSEIPRSDAFGPEKNVIFDGKKMLTKIIFREKLRSGNLIDGPAILTEYSSTIVLPPYTQAVVDEFGNLIITVS